MLRTSDLEKLFPWLTTPDEQVSGADVVDIITAAYADAKFEEASPYRAKYIELAKQHHAMSEGDLECDDTAIVSYSEDGGAYVEAWVWVDATPHMRIGQRYRLMKVSPADAKDITAPVGSVCTITAWSEEDGVYTMTFDDGLGEFTYSGEDIDVYMEAV